MTITSEVNRINDVLKAELPAGGSRKDITILAGSGAPRVLTVGEVVGSVLAGLTALTPVASTANTGDGVPGAVTLGKFAQPGTYVLRCVVASTNAGTFSVRAPGGRVLPDLTVAVAYETDEISLTVADGAADFIVGDTIYAQVIGERKIMQLNLNGQNGSEVPVGFVADDYTAPDGTDEPGVIITRNAVASVVGLKWPAGITADQIEAFTADLEDRGILVRSAA